MAVQIARIEYDHLLIDTEMFGQILDKVGSMPVAILAVSGSLDSSESSIINQLLKYLPTDNDNGDHCSNKAIAEPLWKYRDDQESNEILLWPEPLMTSSVAVLLMEIRGSLTGMVTMKNSLILSFGCLLSSVMIYNVQNDLSEDVLRFLHMTVANSKVFSQLQASDTFGKLLFVVNDWKLMPGYYGFGLHDDQGSPSMRNFKMEKFNIRPSLRPEDRVVRQDILSSFQDITCCLMRHSDKDLDCLEKANGDEAFHGIKRWLFASGNSISKKVNGKEVTGMEYKALMVKWAELFASLKLQPTGTVEEAKSELQSAVAYSVALKYFRNEMTSTINGLNDLSDDQLCEIYAKNKQEAVHMFEGMNRSADQTIRQKYRNMLNEEMQGSLCGYLRENAEERTFYPGQEMAARTTVIIRREPNQESHIKDYCICIFVFKVIAAAVYIAYRIIARN